MSEYSTHLHHCTERYYDSLHPEEETEVDAVPVYMIVDADLRASLLGDTVA